MITGFCTGVNSEYVRLVYMTMHLCKFKIRQTGLNGITRGVNSKHGRPVHMAIHLCKCRIRQVGTKSYARV